MLTLTAHYGPTPQHSLVVTAGQTSDVVLADKQTDPRPSVVLHPNPIGAGRVEATLSSLEAVRAGTAKWVPWPAGTVAKTTMDVVEASFTGLRAVCVSGSILVEVKS